MRFRQVSLPDTVSGRLFLHSMPGRFDCLDNTWEQTRRLAIHAIVCLAPDAELTRHSPDYALALEAGEIPCEVWRLPIEDFGVPQDETALVALAHRAGEALRSGQSLLVHCGAGIGRTGTVAAAVLLILGLDLDAALERVREAGSGPERPCQREILTRIANRRSVTLPHERRLNGD